MTIKSLKSQICMEELKKIGVDIEELDYVTGGRYLFQKILGHGAYGVVYAATDLETNQSVAVKQVTHIFDTYLDAQRMCREIKILANLQHENITNLIDVCANPDYKKFNSIIFVVDLMDADLYKIIYSQQRLQIDHRKYFMYQILRGLKYIHSAEVIHRDLKPSNLLVNENCDLKICDFGLARVVQKNEDIGEYVTTRWYRAPEVLLNYEHTDTSLDIWAVGCIFAELILRKPLFPGKSTLNQLSVIVSTLGSPTNDDLVDCKNQKALRYMKSLPKIPEIEWERKFRTAAPYEIDLLKKMLQWNPKNRISAEDALEHPYFEKLHDPFDEPLTYPISDKCFERNDFKINEFKKMLFDEYKEFHPDDED
ncbi:CMGC family protein kinase [Tritrichomonas foetus]|uniref:Mitogen-activated protein kinase n=1 Tax=Tritrichomonas foetus TaxID=1144522 RepID=A0A1J4K2Q7_9EUKA|nr:CMGC family protein kinase [Tritrichomonas foetus]|eukprot:OHT05671.1 CMGC family protein kinase [Tritrichomonas foetus]